MLQKPLIILAGGFGTRLKSVLNGTPKPLADINGVPFLFYLFENWEKQGFNHFILSLHYKSESIMEYVESLKETILKNCKIQYIVEPVPLGTGGAISYLLDNIEINDYFFVVNADTWIEQGYPQLNKNVDNIIGVINVQDTSRYGKVNFNKDNLILQFDEKAESYLSGYINAGIYKLSRTIFKNWGGKPYSLEKDLFPKLVTKQMLFCELLETNFFDIGVPEDYQKFCNYIKNTNI